MLLANALRREGPSSKAHLSEITRLSRPTVSAGLDDLAGRGLLVGSRGISRRVQSSGRPAQLFRLSRRAGLAVGVDIGRRHIQAVLFDLGRQEIGKLPDAEDAYRAPPSTPTQPCAVLDTAADLVRVLLRRNGSNLGQVAAIGLGVPAPVTHTGEIGSPTLLPGWAGIRPASELSLRLGGVPVAVDNDANLGALAEYIFEDFWRGHDAARSYGMVYVKIAASISAGIVRDGQLWRGASGMAAELGHIPLDYNDRTTCLCGSHGCLELHAGGDVLVRKAQTGWPGLADVLELADRARAGDPYCTTLIREAGDCIGTALGALVNLIGPEQIVVGGELSDAGEILLDPLRERIRRTALPVAANAAGISPARLRKWSSAFGAAVLATLGPDTSGALSS